MKKSLRVLVVDDSRTHITTMKHIMESIQRHTGIVIDLIVYSSHVEYLKNRTPGLKYDVGFFDWNLSKGNDTETKERGDAVVISTNGSCKTKYILTGMTKDIADPSSELIKFINDPSHKVGLLRKREVNLLEEDILKVILSL